MRNKINSAAAVVAGAIGLLAAATAFAQTSPDATTRQAAANLAVNLCSTCHGPEGRGENPLVPRLAGQQRAYIEVQLKAFRSQSRNDPEAHDYMWGIAATLNDNIVAGLAEYYAAQKPATGAPAKNAPVAAAGKALFDKGSPDRGIPPCAACHGMDAEGMSVFPRLAGQHGQYLARQMQMIQKKLRDSPVMHGALKELSDEDIVAVATYLQSK
jgi:cytochrome c553